MLNLTEACPSYLLILNNGRERVKKVLLNGPKLNKFPGASYVREMGRKWRFKSSAFDKLLSNINRGFLSPPLDPEINEEINWIFSRTFRSN